MSMSDDRLEPPPLVQAQFFYFSSLSIDDPLSPGPPVASSDKTSRQHPPQPFSTRDNACLEEAWRSCQTATSEPGHDPTHGRGRSISQPRPRHVFSFPRFRESPKAASSPYSAGESNLGSHADTSALPFSEPDDRTQQAPEHSPKQAPGTDAAASVPDTMADHYPASEQAQHSWASDISGMPFARVPSKRGTRAATRDYQALHVDGPDDDGLGDISVPKDRGKQSKTGIPKSAVPVGVSRLHVVEMPDMIMKPIYWNPINDTSKVIRATWFYKDTMLPVPTDVANLLEVGYEDIMPYLDSYQDELDACVENGAAAEMKVVHKLWPPSITAASAADNKMMMDPDETAPSRRPTPLPSNFQNVAVETEPCTEKRAFETNSVIYVDGTNAQILRPSLLPSKLQKRRPLNAIRKGQRLGVPVVRGFDKNSWQRLHPESRASEILAQARANIDNSHSSHPTASATASGLSGAQNVDGKSELQSPMISDLVLVIHGIGQKLSERVDSFHFTYAINDVRRRVNVELASDTVRRNMGHRAGMMVLPVNWRRTLSFDHEMNSNNNNSNASEDSLEQPRYALSSITPETLPAVRSIVSDVMLDIPYYMSHHKDKMVSAVIREANRIYRLWCANNPGFRENGRVHIVGHSLGSVIAMEILGQQPTRVSDLPPPGEDDKNNDKSGSNLSDHDHDQQQQQQPSSTMFEFDTTNLFICGSPCGFFLWLHNNARLIPRKGRSKPGLETDHLSASIAGKESYGCLAVDNIYNIIHRNDPISYMVNAAVDADYAESLQPANIPSVTSGFWSRLVGRAGTTGGSAYAVTSSAINSPATKVLMTADQPQERPPLISLPSTVELDTHNFTREEIAEKRMYLLNDNGHIDFFLQSSGGPLEIQYLSMLSAHSSYWLSQDFIRFLVMEITRKPGMDHTFPVLRAVKKREFRRVKGTIS